MSDVMDLKREVLSMKEFCKNWREYAQGDRSHKLKGAPITYNGIDRFLNHIDELESRLARAVELLDKAAPYMKEKGEEGCAPARCWLADLAEMKESDK